MGLTRREFIKSAVVAAIAAFVPKTKEVEVQGPPTFELKPVDAWHDGWQTFNGKFALWRRRKASEFFAGVPAETEQKRTSVIETIRARLDAENRAPSMFLEFEDGTVIDCEPWTAVSTWEQTIQENRISLEKIRQARAELEARVRDSVPIREIQNFERDVPDSDWRVQMALDSIEYYAEMERRATNET